ncbi:hypothetical protein CDV36_002634 [Fusarium kuroshium]|uniref:Uncharacterized protein n=3 Tax=Fusarium solani species complex TaxID=232080 RepID=A0A3M2SJC4_9HYPO|nr:hypothetical protein CDV36_002634 [Fusarium kuroshium]RSL39636.1 hypothetical protein CEP51_016788 [Fusarium floridanum]RSL94291.1 hypothetical protein CEP52_012691 [Fusarium oligoseptatum]
MEDVTNPLTREDTIVVSPSTEIGETLDQISEAEFRRLLPRLRTHLEKMGHRTSVEVVADPPRHEKERKPRHVLEKIRATEEYDLPNFELGQHLKDTPITLSVLQLLQIAPSVRQQLSRLMQCRRKIKSNRAKDLVSSLVMPFRDFMTTEMADDLGDLIPRQTTEEEHYLNLGTVNRVDRPIVYCDTAASEDSVANTLGFIEGWVEGERCSAIMLDGGSGVDLVNERYVEELQIPRLVMPVPGQLRMANDQVQRVGSCVYLRVVVGGILATVKAYVLGNHDDWDVLVGRPWLRRMRAVEDHYDDKLVVKGQKGHHQAIPIFPTPNLFEPDDHGRSREPVRPKPMLRSDGEEEIIFVDDDLPILEEVEDILGELGGEIFATAGLTYKTSGN